MRTSTETTRGLRHLGEELALPALPVAVAEALAELNAQMEGEVRTDAVHRALYATDASIYELVPFGVALPKSAADLVKIVKACAAAGIPLTARTAGTSLSGQAVGPGLIVDTGRFLNRVLSIDVERREARAEPGVVRDELNRLLRPHGLMFGPDTSTSNRCMVGGMVGNNSCGSYSIFHGTTRESLVSMEVVLSDGSVAELGEMEREGWLAREAQGGLLGSAMREVRGLVEGQVETIRAAFPKREVKRRNTGYALDDLTYSWMGDEPERKASLARVLCGSEGTLAVTREVTLKLVPVPKATMVVAAHFATIDEAMHATVEAVKHGPAAVELLDKRTLDLSRLNLEQDRNRWFLEGDPGAILVIEFFDETSEAARARCEGVIAALQAAGLGYAFPIIAPPRINSIWELRKAGLGVLMGSPGDRKPQTLVEDTAVAVADLPAYIAEFAQLMARHQVDCVYYAHASVGELHMRPELDFKQPGDVARAEAIAGDVADLVRKYRGSLSGEHGDGRVRGPYIARVMGPEAYGWLERVKQAFDPAGILNPNNITQTRPMTDDWRYHAQYEHREVASAFAYAESGGLQRAVERCNGAGVCRKTPAMGGTMCPSYMVTGEEHDTTRGRANLFRLMLQQGPEAMFTSPALGEALELCVGCKACKSECPASVDMARLKTEYWAGRYALEGTPLAARAFAEVTEWSRLVQELPLGAAVANWVSGTGLAKAVMAKALGLSEKRTMPAISGSSFHDWFGARKQPSRPGAERVCLFVDEFTDRYEPEVGQAAVAVLEAGGFEVIAPVFAPSGRTYLSRGLVAEAREVIGQNVVALDRLLDDVVAVVGLEPSAVLTYIDESVDFADVPWRAAAERVAKKVKLAEDFVGEVAAREPSRWSWQAEPERVMLHGHCHQKALVGTTGAVAALKASGCTVETIPSGCCGMAGSFGYEAKNYEVSMAMGELVLFPAVRGAESSMQVVASGTSCRHQIHDGTGRSSSHAMVVLAGRLKRR